MKKKLKSKKEDSGKYDPDWKPKNAGSEFAIKVVKGVEPNMNKNPQSDNSRGHTTGFFIHLNQNIGT